MKLCKLPVFPLSEQVLAGRRVCGKSRSATVNTSNKSYKDYK
eukprot:SAG31_NODE_3693_length_3983_cov_2.012358_1_plen_42_part_00